MRLGENARRVRDRLSGAYARVIHDVEPGERARLWAVLSVAATVIALEIVSFQTVVFVNEYLAATQVIAVALMGIAAGGLAAFFSERWRADRVDVVTLAVFPIAIVVGLPVIARWNMRPALMMTALAAPYFLASLYISRAFHRLRPGLVYLFDLVGAGLGAWIAVLALPPLREEGSFLLLGILATVPLFIEARARPGAPKQRWAVLGGTAFSLASAAALVLHLTLDPFNLLYYTVVDETLYPEKIFRSLRPKPDGSSPPFFIEYSRGSLVERIDVGFNTAQKRKSPRSHVYLTLFNGMANDNITRRGSPYGSLDRRMPTRLRLGQNPDVFVIGLSAQGMTKPAKSCGDGRVDGVEINPALVDLMEGRLYRLSGRAYKGIDVHVMDARTFLARTDRRYDFITLANTHRIRNIGHEGPPEYLHTREAIRAYLDHLTPKGMAVFEERTVNERAELGVRRFLRTALEVLRERGSKRPADHFAIYEYWPRCRKRVVKVDPNRCSPGDRYTLILLKRTPIDDAEYRHLIQWGIDLDGRSGAPGVHRGIVWRYLPQEPHGNVWTSTLRERDVFRSGGLRRNVHEMSLVTDDRPFPYDVYRARERPWEVLRRTSLLASILVLLPAVVAFFARRKEGRTGLLAGAPRLLNAAALLVFFAVLGIGYLLVEIVLMQRFQIFLSSPVYALAVVLTTLLVASGIGGHLSTRLTKARGLLALLGVAAVACLYALVLGPILAKAIWLPFLLRIVVAMALIAPLGLLMGMPFPWAMDVAKRTLGDRHASLYFGVNGALGALATPLAVLATRIHGFSTTFLFGAAAYGAALVFLSAVRPATSDATASPAIETG